jgi:threonine aldolase
MTEKLPIVDLRSDTVTRPTPAMMEALNRAKLGDDVYGDDPTVNELEQRLAAMTGMQSALYVSSGTQSNLCALLSHLGRGEEFIVGDSYHIFLYEACGGAVLGGLAPHPVAVQKNGQLALDDVLGAIRPDNIHHAMTRLLCLENTYNGIPIPLDVQEQLTDAAHQRGLLVHLDGARIFNAATALGVDVSVLTRKLDSVSICLSKGLGAPVGSVLCGSHEFITRARRNRKILGGGLRQSGLLAACGLYALDHETPRLHEDHTRAKRLADSLAECADIEVLPESAKTNMLFVRPRQNDIEGFKQYLQDQGIVTGPAGSTMRLVIHRDIDDSGIDRIIGAIQDYYRKNKAA